MALPTVMGNLRVPAPVYVRKLRRRSDWGDPTDDEPTQRVRDAFEKMFRLQAEQDISIYLVNTDEDLRRVALGMNAGRDSLKEAIPFVAFLPAEFESLDIRAMQTSGGLPCTHANRLHHDIVATDDQLIRLCEMAMKSGRVAGNCSRGEMKEVIDRATEEHCLTVRPDGPCKVPNC